MRHLTRHDLVYEKTFPFFLEQTSSNRYVYQIVEKNVDFKSGCFFTLLPSNYLNHLIYDFNYGGILPQIDNKKSNKYLNYCPTPNINKEMFEKISSFLRFNKLNIALLEHFNAKPSNKHLIIPTVNVSFIKEEVYYLLTHHTRKKSLIEACNKVTLCWHSLIILSCCDLDNFKEFNDDSITSIVANVRYIITTAYDGEGYIIWEKKIESLKNTQTSLTEKKSEYENAELFG